MRSFGVTLFTLAVVFCLMAIPVSAHESREVGDGINVYFGWRVEPAYTYVLNGPEVFIEPENLTADLRVVISFGPETTTLPLEPVWGEAGHYAANLIPTMPGDYTFRLTGMIGSTPIDEIFTSGDGEFSTVEPLMDIMFPTSNASDLGILLERIRMLEARITALESEQGS